ncbi:hypothetical protein ZIOFF_074703 [Zingiber officinale]|uniref:Pectinesterase catalytic domain-containing protein n=1 Tax=Zingiber officinale TaxID=94328 RepID=A0A8J5C2R6_ZINOF|nr:hypothetical protein ZIOFF_074703 [Zingiber officinale]
MKTELGDLIDPAGWLEWDDRPAPNTLYYGEYMNTGAGADTSRRVTWPGHHVINNSSEAEKFTVGSFLSGDSWIPATDVPFTSSADKVPTTTLSSRNSSQGRWNMGGWQLSSAGLKLGGGSLFSRRDQLPSVGVRQLNHHLQQPLLRWSMAHLLNLQQPFWPADQHLKEEMLPGGATPLLSE